MRRFVVVAVGILLVSGVVLAEVGHLKFVPLSPSPRRLPGMATRPLYTSRLTDPAPGSGTVHPKARVAAVGKLAFALDAKDPKADKLDVLRIDVSGKGTFADAATLPLKAYASRPGTNMTRYSIAPDVTEIQVAGHSVPVHAYGYYYKYSRGERFYIYLNAMAEGSVRIGEKVCGVRVFDGNGNLQLGDGPSFKDKKTPTGMMRAVQTGDTVLVDTTGPTFKTQSVLAYNGQRMQVGTQWYELSIDAKTLTISAKPVAPKMARLVIPHEKWSARLLGEKHVLQLSGGTSPIAVPADTYVIGNYQEHVASGVASKPHRLSAGRRVAYGSAGPVTKLPAGKTTKLAIGSPLQATVSVYQSKGTIRFNALVQDAAGARVDSIYGPKGRPPVPTVTVLDADDKKIYSAKLKYG